MDENFEKFLDDFRNDLNASEESITLLRNIADDSHFKRGYSTVISHLKEMISKTSSSLLIYTPHVIPEILESISISSYRKKRVRFLMAANTDKDKYQNIFNKMLLLGNVQFRDMPTPINYYWCARDGREFLIGKQAENSDDIFSMIHENELHGNDFYDLIGTYFLNLSSPLLSERVKAKIRRKYYRIKNAEKKQKLLRKLGLKESDL